MEIGNADLLNGGEADCFHLPEAAHLRASRRFSDTYSASGSSPANLGYVSYSDGTMHLPGSKTQSSHLPKFPDISRNGVAGTFLRKSPSGGLFKPSICSRTPRISYFFPKLPVTCPYQGIRSDHFDPDLLLRHFKKLAPLKARFGASGGSPAGFPQAGPEFGKSAGSRGCNAASSRPPNTPRTHRFRAG